MGLKITVFNVAMYLSIAIGFAQHSGNSVIGQNYYSKQEIAPHTIGKLYLSDSSFLVGANVLANVIADNYVVTFGISDSATTLKEANSRIDSRIQNFIASLIKMGIAKTDIYVDMTTQTEIADYKVMKNYAEQYISGFEQKKNVIIQFKNINDLDKMIITASGYGIYDIAKVDYNVTDINKIYLQLFQTAMDVINGKKKLYATATNVQLLPTSEIYSDSFYSFYPAQLYKSYTPDVSTVFQDNDYGKRKNLQKNTTYYYDKLNYSGFDKVINPIVTEPAVEFILNLQLKFYIY
jgi:uncharacterized protein YggE